ncbi:uncharacterized protein LOC110976098 [Acanthaster planci]|uniref:Uncharacterized protein LOC110976098 n=1 Tax=Acanthaster planci TaxID=133434 RepID=A0A8B7XWZ4_ACAPL|nr:uncharacterized protein LOC110976098 [Acanthaster planci]XP_022084782.1 uncharacterized protein LOC110976098 [Acanthaster planci]XP_022084783.1 uncharacterized protein LOC110976098 [Acanthaster planci]
MGDQPMSTGADSATMSTGADSATMSTGADSATMSTGADSATESQVNERSEQKASRGSGRRKDDDALWQLAGELGASWKPIGRNLGFKEPRLENLEMDHSFDAHERAYQMLLKWKNKTPPPARGDKLRSAVEMAGRLDIMPLVEKTLKFLKKD